jgi:aspartyl-tRNA(Asn)/glutamyl-tRNA(Gln) amidotransferase subunit A
VIDVPASLTEAASLLRSRAITSLELTEAVLDRADRLDPRLGTYLERFDDTARAAAMRADREFAAGMDRGLLQGIPIGVKDLLAAREGATTAQSLVLDRRWGAGRDAHVVMRLREAGAVITGKLVTMEFAIGAPDPTKPFPIPRNPWHPDATPGGSSSGAGNGVAAGLFLAAIGTDTGGSIRIPAAYCGVSGLKPTFGLVGKSGCVPLSYSLDHVGPLARSVADCAAVLQAIAGHDPDDASSAEVPIPDFVGDLGAPLAGLRVGVARLGDRAGDVAIAVQRAVADAVGVLEGLGATTTVVDLPLYEEADAALGVIEVSEAFAYHRPDLQSRWKDYTRGARQMIVRGALLSGGDYVQAQRVRQVIIRDLGAVFETVDVVVSPTVGAGGLPSPAIVNAPVETILRRIFTRYWSLTGLPALALPVGTDSAGLPLSMQIAARPFEEQLLLRVGHAYQMATRWHLAMPPLIAAVEDR